ncbi:hypothetical protein [Hoyosella altamirensis]|uniref:Uncharacterized protein n=1 Tax=Hoyosella altamirensis TaxID=616997 RepID=A0A839RSP9_9ACTN|nr:hypothetical protein [Hoyosella altamirensis]MBB3039590.1 hypothetical protein [Hoyosella altamirensis]
MGRVHPALVPHEDAVPLAAMRAPNYDPELPVLTREDVVAFCHSVGNPYVNLRTVIHADATGRLRSCKVAGRRFYSERDVRAWLAGGVL